MSGRAALLLVDLQWDFLAPGPLEPDAATLVADIADLLGWWRAQGLPVVHVHTLVEADLSDAMPHWRAKGERRCIRGSAGAEPPPELAPEGAEPVFVKQGYDGFEDAGLLTHLQDAGIERVAVAGVHTHACIRATALAAYRKGFEVLVADECVGSYDPEHAAHSRDWLAGRGARFLGVAALKAEVALRTAVTAAPTWQQRDPTDWDHVLREVPLAGPRDVHRAVETLNEVQPALERMPLAERISRLAAWRDALARDRSSWTATLVHEVAKPLRDAEGEVAYALALLDHLCATASDHEEGHGREVHYRPLGTVALITPWNNPFAMPVSKLAPALAFGNAAVWKPALSGYGVAERLVASLAEAGLGDWVRCVPGDAATGRALVEARGIAAVAFTGSVAVGQAIVRRCGQLLRPVQAELGGNNAAIVLADADLEAVAADLAGAMFSFAGQRCTAIRRVIVENAANDRFRDALVAAIEGLVTGDPQDGATQVGPVVSKDRQQALLADVAEAVASGARLLTGGTPPSGLPEDGCWIAPTLLADVPESSPILTRELFGPVVAQERADNLLHAIGLHNRGEHGLLGALYSTDPTAQARFLAEAQAGMLLLNQARPAFSPAGPFTGWKGSGFGIPEHGRWNRDFYTRVQAVYCAL